MTLSPLGDSAVVISLGDSIDATTAARVRALAAEVGRMAVAGVVDIVPAFADVALFFDSAHVPRIEKLRHELAPALERAQAAGEGVPGRAVEIPVCYGGEDGPDLEEVAARAGVAPGEVARRHASGDYLVQAIGFMPGFPYLGGLAPELVAPRRATPRPRVPAGSVGIGGGQTGVYPLESPGGWNLIGRTPLRLFDPGREQPALLHLGDRVKFQAISLEEFQSAAPRAALIGMPGAALEGCGPPGGADRRGIEVIRPGMGCAVQDLGRTGWRASGVSLAGVADGFALRVANLLVGNPEGAAGLEFALAGPELRFSHEAVVALGGAEFEGLPRWRPVQIAAGTTLKLGAARAGCRGCLAVAGGIEVAPVLGSRSTDLRAGFGGLGGRALAAGAWLPVGSAGPSLRGGSWHIDERMLPEYSREAKVRVVAGAQAREFAPEWLGAKFTVSRLSDRMGVRLEGPALERRGGRELLSTPVVPGTIQVPPDGKPIVLLADAQTIGGYPQVAHVASVDLPLVAQLRPGDTVRFGEVPLAEAGALRLAR
ncbi:MAG: 5-oxoprolinase subunit PxpB, partial [Verrucomicrobia bacterium]|nr:5-oxoprolinase subunit PxpB [Verrucomicrobiota bacterium]